MGYQTDGARTVSADEFSLHPAANDRSELVRGHIRRMTPASAAHGLVSGNVFRLLSTYIQQHRLGVCFADSTGFTLPNLPNTVRAPDASFVRADRLPAAGVGDGFLHLAPDLAVEVLSPSESAASLAEKLADYRVAGTPLVWVIDPSARTVAVIVRDDAAATFGVEQEVTGGDVVPGFVCQVSELFEGLAQLRAD